MSGAIIQLVAKNVAGFGLSDGRSVSCPGVSGKSVIISPHSSCNDYKTLSMAKIASLKCASQGRMYVCKASPGGHRRNPDFSRQNNDHGFSRSRNRQTEERESSGNFEESDFFPSKNGALVSFSGTPKFRATATPGPREKEIVELFRKVQAQLRERSAMREEKKIQNLQGKDKENEYVDSLLKLLRRHSSQQGKRSNDLILDQPEHKSPSDEEKSTTFLNSNKDTRPISNFQRKSPVPHVKFEPIYSDENSVNSVSDTNLNAEREKTCTEPRIEREPEVESTFSNEDISEDGVSETNEGYSEVDAGEQEETMKEDLSAMKVPELRVLAKSRGLKGFSKLKKGELVELLSGG